MDEKNMGWDCECTNKHACEYHKKVSFYRGTEDYGRLPIEYRNFKKIINDKYSLWTD